MAVAFVGVSTVLTMDYTVTLQRPSGTQDGDWMVAAVAMNQAAPDPSWESGSGWVEVAVVREDAIEDLQCRVWVRQATSSDPPSWTLSTNASYGDNVAAAITTWRGAEEPDVAATTIHPGRGGPFTLPTLQEGPGEGGVILHVVGACCGTWSGDDWTWNTPPAGWTGRVLDTHLDSDSTIGLAIVEGADLTGPELTISGVGAETVAARSATLLIPSTPEPPSGPVVLGWGPAPVYL